MRSKIITLASLFLATACASNQNGHAQAPTPHQTSTGTTPAYSVSPTDRRASATYDGTGGAMKTTRHTEVWAEGGSGGARASENRVDTSDHSKNVDNTKINERDRRDNTLTPMDQGNSSSETKISADIRKAIMDVDTLSFTAKNVKIITEGTKVTLRGPVNSTYEKSAIESIARQTAGVSAVDSQLEVKK